MSYKDLLDDYNLPELPANWQILSLEEICIGVIDCPHSTPKLVDKSDFYMAKTQDIRTGHLNTLTTSCVSQETYLKRTQRAEPQNGDLLFSREGTYFGDAAEVPLGMQVCLGQRMVLIKPKKEIINSAYLRIFINSKPFQKYLCKFHEGTVAQRINVSEIRKLPILLPPMKQQVFVKSQVSSVENKIKTNSEINKTLEEMAQAIFKSWFVDFDPVKAKMRGEQPEDDAQGCTNGAGGRTPVATMDAETAALFPDKLVESELGMIPEGWEVFESSEIANVGIGKTPPRKESNWFSKDDNDIRWISIRNMGDTGVYALSSSEYLTRDAIEKFNIKIIPDNTLILSFKLTVGRVAITNGEMTTNEAIAHYKLDDNAKISTNFLYLYMKTFDFDALGNTSSIAKAVNSKIIKSLPIIVPSKKIIDLFDNIVKPLFETMKINQLENQTLTKLRDTLLPKLLSGEFDPTSGQEQ
ncbi:MAG: restriction endonuclease subunit S [Desulfotalea sp.]